MSSTQLTTSQTSERCPARLPFVSVIIPVRNDAARLAVCLQSLQRQSYPGDNFEVIVVDNGSDDPSLETAQKNGAKTLRHPKLRVGALRNRGVAQASGEILAFVDSDHEVPQHWINSAVNALVDDTSIRVIGSPCLAPSNGTWVQRCWEHHRLRDRRRRNVDWLGAGNMFLWKNDFDLVGGFNEDLTATEDVDLCVRIAKCGAIVSDVQLANTHFGEPRTLLAFSRKEIWRGSSGLRAFLSHGMPLHEIPSLIWPLYHLIAVSLLLASLLSLFAGWSYVLPLLAASLLLAPSLLLATQVCFRVHKVLDIIPLTVLYLVYGLSRAVALFR